METELLEKKLTPMMEQWHQCKEQAKGALLLFRLGDFYEAFEEDAKIVADALELTLTHRQGIPMSGIPWHTSEGYIDRLVSKGFRVAVAEQMEDPRETKGIVKRQITRFVTPGTLIQSALLGEKTNNFLSALTQVGAFFGLASIDVSTGEFKVIECEDEKEMLNELSRLRPAELLVGKKFKQKYTKLFSEIDLLLHPLVTVLDDWAFDHKSANEILTAHFKVLHLEGFGLAGMVAAINAAGGLLSYLKEDLALPTQHIRTLQPYTLHSCLSIDRLSQRNLELTESVHQEGRKGTLLNLIDFTMTPMGGRLLTKWIKAPLLNPVEIKKRQDAIEELLLAQDRLTSLQRHLSQIRDLERLMMRISSGYASAKDLVSLRFSLEALPAIRDLSNSFSSLLLISLKEKLIDLSSLSLQLKNALVEDPPLRLSDGYIFKEGYHPQLDELRLLTHHGKEWIARYQLKLREETGIKTLKVNYNKVFGYYIEVSKGQAAHMPVSFHRRQTLVNAERFISPELKEYETKVLSAEEKMLALETELFHALRLSLIDHRETILSIAKALGDLDALQSLAESALRYRFKRPEIDESGLLHIVEGRHPVVESALPQGLFIPNDTHLDRKGDQLMIITGPNMAGKSTYIRQVALIVILAQMGSFVPAKQAHIGIVDRIFTRIGATDDLLRGQSTFMVEMNETAQILNNATDRSLVILDEIGRGTSTYDGVAIAWAVAEYLLVTEGKKARTLFATHFCELTQLEKIHTHAFNMHVTVQEHQDDILFLHKMAKGGTDRSYGIHVARLAGVPVAAILRAQQVLQQLESSGKKEKFNRKDDGTPKEKQLLLF